MSQKGRLFHCVEKSQVSEQDFTPEIAPNRYSTHNANGQRILAALELQYSLDCQTCKTPCFKIS